MITETPAGRVLVLYDGMMVNAPIGIALDTPYAGMLVARHVDGAWVTLANLKLHREAILAVLDCVTQEP